MSTLVQASDINTKRTNVSTLATNAKLSVSLPAAVSAGTIVGRSDFNLLQTAINSLEANFSNNCCQSECNTSAVSSVASGNNYECGSYNTVTVTNTCVLEECTDCQCSNYCTGCYDSCSDCSGDNDDCSF